LAKAQKNIQGGLDDIDKLVGVRTRVIQKKLSSIETMDPDTASNIIGEKSDILMDSDSDLES